LRGNGLTKLPKNIGNMINLIECDLGANRIEKIPDSISNLYKLKILKLEKNMLSNYEQKRITELLPNCDVQHR
jgi:Leucine-rich repeat (LRR) protein